MKETRVIHEGKPYKLRALRVGENLWLHVGGETFMIEPMSAKAKSAAPGGGREGSGKIIAPMPGKILKIKVAVGDAVDAGQVLVVMEAMKMEYSLTAAIKGRVKKVSIKDGDQVELNQVLVDLEAGAK